MSDYAFTLTRLAFVVRIDSEDDEFDAFLLNWLNEARELDREIESILSEEIGADIDVDIQWHRGSVIGWIAVAARPDWSEMPLGQRLNRQPSGSGRP